MRRLLGRFLRVGGELVGEGVFGEGGWYDYWGEEGLSGNGEETRDDGSGQDELLDSIMCHRHFL